MNLLKPDKLQRGDTIGIVATSFPLPENLYPEYQNEYRKAVGELENLGFKTKEGKNLRKVKWWFAGTPDERASDINDMFADPDVKAIIVHEGGQSAIAVLEYLDFDLISKNPKPFIGFSDVTNIHIAMYSKVGLVGFQGPLLTYSLGKIWEKYLPEKRVDGLKLFFEILTSDKPLGNVSALTKWECWREGQTTGNLFGGNLSNFVSLIGTKYFPNIEDLKGCILFWETDNTPSYRIEKGLYQLKYAGILDVISGMLIGKLPGIKRTAFEGLEEPSSKELIMEILKNYKFPILGRVDFGHETVSIPVPIGINAKMDASSLNLEYLEAAVK